MLSDLPLLACCCKSKLHDHDGLDVVTEAQECLGLLQEAIETALFPLHLLLLGKRQIRHEA